MSKPSVTLVTLSLYLKDSANPYKKIPLDKIEGKTNKDIHDLLSELSPILATLLNNLVLITTLGNAAKIVRIEPDGRCIKGLVETGKTGTSQNILDTETGIRSYQTKLKDAVMLPHYFMFYIPEDQNKAVIFLQRYKQSGVQTLLLDHIEREFKKKFPRYSFVIQYLTDTDTFNKLLKDAHVKEIRLTENVWSSDKTDNIDGPKEKKGSLSVIYKPIRSTGNEFLDKMKRLNAKELEMGNILELPESFIEPDEASFVIARKNGKDRRISFEDSGAIFRSYYDITNEVKSGNDGYPTFESIDKIVQDMLPEVSEGLYEPRIKD